MSTTLTCLLISTHTMPMDSQTSCESSLVYRPQVSCVYGTKPAVSLLSQPVYSHWGTPI